jgi:hypothetical protein
MGLDMDDKYSGDEASQEAEPSSKGGEQRTKCTVVMALNETFEKNETTVNEGDMITAIEGVGLTEKETGIVMAEESSPAPTQEQVVTA